MLKDLPPPSTCPSCGEAMLDPAEDRATCPRCSPASAPVHMPDPSEGRAARRAYFSAVYGALEEPWDYSQRGAEVLRHDLVVRLAEKLAGTGARRVLDVGCSLGQLTARLAGIGADVHGIDLSPAAVWKARARCQSVAQTRSWGRSSFRFYAGSALELPVRPASFDLLLLCDGLHSWCLTAEEKQTALREAARAVVPGGYVILTEALKPPQIEPFIDEVRNSVLHLEDVRFLNDRLWFSVERALRPLRRWRVTRRALASRGVARALSVPARLAGVRGTKHICLVARNPITDGEM